MIRVTQKNNANKPKISGMAVANIATNKISMDLLQHHALSHIIITT